MEPQTWVWRFGKKMNVGTLVNRELQKVRGRLPDRLSQESGLAQEALGGVERKVDSKMIIAEYQSNIPVLDDALAEESEMIYLLRGAMLYRLDARTADALSMANDEALRMGRPRLVLVGGGVPTLTPAGLTYLEMNAIMQKPFKGEDVFDVRIGKTDAIYGTDALARDPVSLDSLGERMSREGGAACLLGGPLTAADVSTLVNGGYIPHRQESPSIEGQEGLIPSHRPLTSYRAIFH